MPVIPLVPLVSAVVPPTATAATCVWRWGSPAGRVPPWWQINIEHQSVGVSIVTCSKPEYDAQESPFWSCYWENSGGNYHDCSEVSCLSEIGWVKRPESSRDCFLRHLSLSLLSSSSCSESLACSRNAACMYSPWQHLDLSQIFYPSQNQNSDLSSGLYRQSDLPCFPLYGRCRSGTCRCPFGHNYRGRNDDCFSSVRPHNNQLSLSHSSWCYGRSPERLSSRWCHHCDCCCWAS